MEYEAGLAPEQAWPGSSTEITLAPAGNQAKFRLRSGP
jgi:hypothetical protein